MGSFKGGEAQSGRSRSTTIIKVTPEKQQDSPPLPNQGEEEEQEDFVVTPLCEKRPPKIVTWVKGLLNIPVKSGALCR